MRTLAAALLILLAAPGCSNDANVGEASCSACSGKSYTADDCRRASEAAGCRSYAFASPSGACATGCTFKECNEPPTCSAASTPTDAGADVAVDPACMNAADGVFTVTPPCADYDTVTINGAKKYICKCGACPCGFVCGSVSLNPGFTTGCTATPD